MNFKNDIISKFWFLPLFFVVVLSSCSKDDRVVTLYDKGEVTATASATDINEGESVTFESTASKVQSLIWTFEGGSPGSSTSENVTVTYAAGGTYEAVLEVKFIDNTIQRKVFTINVTGTPVSQAPYNGTALVLPGTIEAENYDFGGEGFAYHDTEEENLAVTAGSPTYREDDGIDLQVGGGIVNIGYTNTDEWVEYTVNVAQTAAYNFEFHVASDPGGNAIKIQSVDANDNVTDLGELPSFAGTGGWGVYTPIMVNGVNLTAGEQVLRFHFTGGATNLDKVVVSSPIVTATYGIYRETATTSGTPVITEINNAFLITETTTAPFEGTKALEFKFNAQDTWGVMGAIRPDNGAGAAGTVDISAFATGFYNITLKTNCTLKMNLRLQGGGVNGFVQLDAANPAYGMLRDGNWHTLKIPVSAFVTDAGAAPDYTQISHLLVLRSAEAAVLATEDWDWYVDNIYFSEN